MDGDKRVDKILKGFGLSQTGHYGEPVGIKVTKAALKKLVLELVPEEDKRTPLELNLEVDNINFNDKAEAGAYQWGFNECRTQTIKNINLLFDDNPTTNQKER